VREWKLRNQAPIAETVFRRSRLHRYFLAFLFSAFVLHFLCPLQFLRPRRVVWRRRRFRVDRCGWRFYRLWLLIHDRATGVSDMVRQLVASIYILRCVGNAFSCRSERH